MHIEICAYPQDGVEMRVVLKDRIKREREPEKLLPHQRTIEELTPEAVGSLARVLAVYANSYEAFLIGAVSEEDQKGFPWKERDLP